MAPFVIYSTWCVHSKAIGDDLENTPSVLFTRANRFYLKEGKLLLRAVIFNRQFTIESAFSAAN